MSEYREYIDHTAAIRRKRFDLTGWGRENAFIADGDRIKDDTLYTRTSKELLSNPQTKLAKKSDPVFVKTSERQIREDFTKEPTGIRTSEAEQMQLSIEESLAPAEVADVTDGSNLESRERAAADETNLTIITPSIVTETPKITELTASPIERQPVLRKAVETPKKAKQQGQVEEQEVAVPHVVKEQLKTEKDRLEQESLELAMQLAEEERLKLEARKSSKKEESDYWSKSSGSESYIAESPKSIVMSKSAIQLQREEETRLKLQKSLAKIEDEANEEEAEQTEEDRQRLEKEAAEQLRLKEEEEEREVRRKEELEKQQAAELELLAKQQRLEEEAAEQLKREKAEERLAKLEEAAKQLRLEEVRRKAELEKQQADELLAEQLEEERQRLEREETAERLRKIEVAEKLEAERLERENAEKLRLAKLEEERLEAAEQLEEAIAVAELAVVRLNTARQNLDDTRVTNLEETTLNSIETEKELLEIGERTQLLKLIEYLNALTKGMNVTAKSFEDPENIKHIKAAVKLRQEKEEAERLKAELEKQQAAKLLVKQSSEETHSQKPLSLWDKFTNLFPSKKSANVEEIEMIQVNSLDLRNDEDAEIYAVGENLGLSDSHISHVIYSH